MLELLINEFFAENITSFFLFDQIESRYLWN
jgi:hypothetical protein